VKTTLRAGKHAKPIRRGAEEQIQQIYRKLAHAWGPQHWWPAETPFEVIVGAILTQNTSWTNVERAMANLREAGVLSLEGIRATSIEDLEPLVRSSGYFRQKARRLKDLVTFVDETHDGSLATMLAMPTEALRLQLLGQKGIGMETADSILLYAGLHPVFVVDAYTRRILERHSILGASANYDEIRLLVERALAGETAEALGSLLLAVGQRYEGARSGEERKANDEERVSSTRPAGHPPSPMSMAKQSRLSRIYNEMHGLLVQVGKHYCHKQQPDCERCPVGEMLSARQRRMITLGRTRICGTGTAGRSKSNRSD
jgi:endonuclease-3 related protein